MWSGGCEGAYEEQCKENSAIYRFSLALVIVFSVQFLGTAIWPAFYDKFWWSKFLIFTGCIIAFSFMNSDTFNDNGYAWFARFSAFLFVIVQQIILLDFAFTWNEKWVSYSLEADGEDGSTYLNGLLAFSALLFVGSFISLVFMYIHFTCDEATTIITLTLVLTIFATLIQLMGEHGSLLTSAIMTAYSTFLCFSAITLNPYEDCNPTIGGDSQTVSKVIGMLILMVTLSWTTTTTVKKVTELAQKDAIANGSPILPSATGNKSRDDVDPEGDDDTAAPVDKMSYTKEMRNLLMEVCIIFILISTYYAMVVTNWATEQAADHASSVSAGETSMWLQASAQWVAIAFYIWTLIAPSLFPDRDFSGY
jgi:hypothetical protein